MGIRSLTSEQEYVVQPSRQCRQLASQVWTLHRKSQLHIPRILKVGPSRNQYTPHAQGMSITQGIWT